ncbi:MAG: acetyl/propionyl/methylcrotonyl-CoA carboxylase subunit alpha [Acidimicrobiales bacterium]
MFSTVLIANRGEIAVRVIRTCRELGIKTVAVYSEIDRGALHVRLADVAYSLGGQTAAESYLNTAAILDVIRRSGADAVHPGYGFFSENADFARAITAEGVTFVGPPADAIEVMGDKISSRIAASGAGVAGVPGTTTPIAEVSEVVAFGDEHGWPVAIKAAFGGGGRGMKVVGDAAGAPSAMESAQREAQAYFGRPEIYLERYLTWPRHVEMQVFADTHGNAVWLGERDCSCQRRHQKLIEESPAPDFPDDVRLRMGEAAVKVARACGYVNAGTVEFLYQDGEFFFLEMNTRLQVEHPVTELVTGMDLVELQLRVASGEALPDGLVQGAAERRGHAIQCRINAENPAGGRFLPSPGTLRRFRRADGYGVRTDAGYDEGDTVSQFYDNLVAKLVVWGADRDEARRRMLRALGETEIEGVATTIPAHVAILSHPDFAAATHSTRWVEDRLDLSGVAAPTPPGAPGAASQDGTGEGSPQGATMPKDVEVEVDGRRHKVRVWIPAAEAGGNGAGDVEAGAGGGRTGGGRTGGGRTGGGRTGGGRTGGSPRSERPKRPASGRAPGAGSGRVTVPMQGTIVKLLVAVGDRVELGQAVCVLEAMKMENHVLADKAGEVTEVSVAAGDTVGAGDVVAVIS